MAVGRVTYPTTVAASTQNYIKLNILEKKNWFKIIKFF
jgi:hypothetical protein